MKIVKDIEHMCYVLSDSGCIIEFVWYKNRERFQTGVFISMDDLFEHMIKSNYAHVKSNKVPSLSYNTLIHGEIFLDLGKDYPEYFI